MVCVISVVKLPLPGFGRAVVFFLVELRCLGRNLRMHETCEHARHGHLYDRLCGFVRTYLD
jgi:hypothetical protein